FSRNKGRRDTWPRYGQLPCIKKISYLFIAYRWLPDRCLAKGIRQAVGMTLISVVILDKIADAIASIVFQMGYKILAPSMLFQASNHFLKIFLTNSFIVRNAGSERYEQKYILMACRRYRRIGFRGTASIE